MTSRNYILEPSRKEKTMSSRDRERQVRLDTVSSINLILGAKRTRNNNYTANEIYTCFGIGKNFRDAALVLDGIRSIRTTSYFIMHYNLQYCTRLHDNNMVYHIVYISYLGKCSVILKRSYDSAVITQIYLREGQGVIGFEQQFLENINFQETRVLEGVTFDSIGINNVQNKITQTIWTKIWIINV